MNEGSSAPTDPPAANGEDAAVGHDRGGRDRILDAAIARFAAQGVSGTSLKVIAQDAGVSQALIVHHFGTKEGLRDACDDLVLGTIREQMRRAAAEGKQMDVLEAFRRRQQQHASALPYVGRLLAEGSPSAVRLVDELADEMVRTTQEYVDNGIYEPTEFPRERAIVLLIWSLGAVTLHEHLHRLIGADITGEPAELLPYLKGATELLVDGLFTEAMKDNVRSAITQLEGQGS
jgi:AcrR family transcriptional regulator